MKRIIIILHFCLFIFTLNCASYRIKSIRNDFDGYTIYRMKRNNLSSANPLILLTSTTVSLNLQKLQFDYLTSSYSLIVTYYARDWIFIEEGQSLKLIVDGKNLGFEGNGSWNSRNVLYDGSIEEMAYYNITPEQIKTIMNAKVVKVRIEGSQYFTKRHFNKTNFDNFRKFYNQFCIIP